MKPMTQVILTQHKAKTDRGQVDLLFRVAKLIGSASFYIGNQRYHVGDVLSERECELLEGERKVKITVTEKGGEPVLGDDTPERPSERAMRLASQTPGWKRK